MYFAIFRIKIFGYLYFCSKKSFEWHEMGVAWNTHGRNAHKILVRKPGGKRPLGRPWIILKWIFRE